jgi:sialate O-acetylesterase
MTRRVFLALSLLLTWSAVTVAQQPAVGAKAVTGPRLAAIFGDNMVLQRGIAVPVWGWAQPGEAITVTFRDQKKVATAAPCGKWMAKLDPMEAGGPFEMTVAGPSGSVTLKNVLVGEVWICSGQSNMEWSLSGAHNAKEAIANSANPMLRHFGLQKASAPVPLADCNGRWEEADPRTAGHFTAVGYFFGEKLQKELKVPIGLIHTSWGGTAIEAWTSLKATEADPALKGIADGARARVKAAEAEWQKHLEEAAAARREGKLVPATPKQPGPVPTALYNAMIAPIVPYGIAGAIWYQGESNAGNAKLYQKQMPGMIKNWREDWGQGEFPFFMVSLANFMARINVPTDTAWARLREAQAMTTQNTPKVGVAIAIDVGDAKDIHPRDKQSVGQRLALNALAIAYNKPIVYSGPVYESMKVDGAKACLKFKHVGGGLVAKGEKLTGFAIAGEDKKFVWADATIEGDTVVVSSKEVAAPVAVRYAWADNPECNFYNKEGLPAVPFRTDTWEAPPPAPAKKR